jgi:hypothetical protein
MAWMDNCAACAFAEPGRGGRGRECRRHAPTAVAAIIDGQRMTSRKVWPKVEDDDWCGDFEARRGFGDG